jgi:hypothetical protein
MTDWRKYKLQMTKDGQGMASFGWARCQMSHTCHAAEGEAIPPLWLNHPSKNATR